LFPALYAPISGGTGKAWLDNSFNLGDVIFVD
jgi:hypothetical protein